MIALRLVLAAPDQRVELDASSAERGEVAGGGGEDGRTAGPGERIDVAGDEQDCIHLGQLVPGQRILVAPRPHLRSHGRDRPLTELVDMRERPPLRTWLVARVHVDAVLLELGARAPRELVVSEGSEEVRLAREERELDRGHTSPAADLFPVLGRVGDLARGGQPLDPGEADPLDMADHGDAHRPSLTDAPHTVAVARVSEDDGRRADSTVRVLLRTHRDEVLSLLRRRLGRDGADDAFQETFLRALRAYDRLDHGEHLRAWVLTIAARVAIDAHRRARPTAELPDLAQTDSRPAYEELGELTAGLPAKERAAVVLRYGYDLTYDQIAAALDSSPVAARQAASAGVRRLRKEARR